MQNLDVSLAEIVEILKTVFPEIPKIESIASKYFEEGLGKKGTHFFKIRYDPGDVIMSKGAFSDYAAIRLSGSIGVYQESAPGGELRPLPSCWSNKGRLRLRIEAWVNKYAPQTGVTLHPLFVAQAVDTPWKARVARVLRRLLEFGSKQDFETISNPVASSSESPKGTLTPSHVITPPDGNTRRADRILGTASALWNTPRTASLVAHDSHVDVLLVKSKAMREFVDKEKNPAYRAEFMNHFADYVLPPLLSESRLLKGLPIDFLTLAQVLAPSLQSGESFLEFKKGKIVCEFDSPSDAYYLIISGVVKVYRNMSGVESLVNHLSRGDSFGETCIDPGSKRTARVVAACELRLLMISQATMLDLLSMPEFQVIESVLRGKRSLYEDIDEAIAERRRQPPLDPPEHLASKLLLAQNLLVIDMEKCTRCDECVAACADTHHGVPRFQRSNPDYRFGKWEVAGACVHCTDSPCQSVCPVGAIGRVDTGAVQIDRDRCIGCGKCPDACPFDVIQMSAPLFPQEADSLAQKLNTVATKCDLCLTTNGGAPPCVASCPHDAAFRGSPLELFPELSYWAEG